MGRWKQKIIGVFAFFLVLCFSVPALAWEGYKARYLEKLQGQWYDPSGNLVLDVQDSTLNGCQIVDIFSRGGSASSFNCVVRVVEATGYRDLQLACKSFGSDDYHQHVWLKENSLDSDSTIFLSKPQETSFYESVGGIGIDMPKQMVIAKYGNPGELRQITNKNGQKVGEVWKYDSLGLELHINHDVVSSITIFKNGDRHFDRTGFNCENSLDDFKTAYGFGETPRTNAEHGYGVGHGEYMWFTNYPYSITLNTTWN